MTPRKLEKEERRTHKYEKIKKSTKKEFLISTQQQIKNYRNGITNEFMRYGDIYQ